MFCDFCDIIRIAEMMVLKHKTEMLDRMLKCCRKSN